MEPWLMALLGLGQSVLAAFLSYFAVRAASRPAKVDDDLADHGTRLAVLESSVADMKADVKAVRALVERTFGK